MKNYPGIPVLQQLQNPSHYHLSLIDWEKEFHAGFHDFHEKNSQRDFFGIHGLQNEANFPHNLRKQKQKDLLRIVDIFFSFDFTPAVLKIIPCWDGSTDP